MSGTYLANPLLFLIDTLFSLYILAVMLRFLLQWVRADFFNPISQFLVSITQPLLKPLRRVVPGVAGIDLSSVVLMVLLQMALLCLVMLIKYGTVALGPVVLRTPVELINLLFNLYLFAIIIQAVISWVNPDPYNPVHTVLFRVTEPVLRPFRSVIPPLGGIDLSPLAAIIMLQVLKMLVMPPLNTVAPPI